MNGTVDDDGVIHDAQDAARMFLMGRLIDASSARWKGLSVPWTKLSEKEQAKLLNGLADDIRAAVQQAITAIASNERLTFRAEVESIQFKGPTDVKAVLKMVVSSEAHALADTAGGYVTVVIEDTTQLLDIPAAAVTVEPDNGSLQL